MLQPRIHIVGLGSIGTFVAHCLAEIPRRPSVSLLLHRPSLVQDYQKNGNQITLKTNDGQIQRRDKYFLEVLDGNQWHHASVSSTTSAEPPPLDNPPISDPIDNLIFCVKATQTVDALRALQHRLTRDSTVLFLQNGSGMIEAANEHLFTTATTRPNYMTGVISHGVGLLSAFNITHTGVSATAIGPVPRSDNNPTTNPSPSALLTTLPQSPTLNTSTHSYVSILQLQLEKLAVNAFSNPLCALHDTQTKFLFSVPHLRRRLILEISAVALALPELAGVDSAAARFHPDALEATVADIIERNAETTCSMVWDLRARKRTEIDFINGYWAKRGREVGVETPFNDELVERVKVRESERMGGRD